MMARYYLVYTIIFVLSVSLPCPAQEHLVFSRPENLSGIATLMGERVLEEAYARLGIDFEFMELPNARSLYTANMGGTDGEFQRIAGLEQAYPNLIMVPVPIGYVDIVVFTINTEFPVEGWRSLAPYTIGFVRGFKKAESHTQKMNVEKVSSVEQAFQMLQSGRVDIVVDSLSALYKIKDSEKSGIRILQPPLDKHVVYHYLHIRHASLALELEAVLRDMGKNGELEALQEQAMQDFPAMRGQ